MIEIGELKLWEAFSEPGNPICIVDAGGNSTKDKPLLARSLELYLNDAGYIIGIRVTRHSPAKSVVEAEIGDVQPLAEIEEIG